MLESCLSQTEMSKRSNRIDWTNRICRNYHWTNRANRTGRHDHWTNRSYRPYGSHRSHGTNWSNWVYRCHWSHRFHGVNRTGGNCHWTNRTDRTSRTHWPPWSMLPWESRWCSRRSIRKRLLTADRARPSTGTRTRRWVASLALAPAAPRSRSRVAIFYHVRMLWAMESVILRSN